MFERFALALTGVLWSAIALSAEVPALLKAADEFRLAPGAMKVETQVLVMKAGQQEKERRYTVFAQAKHQSLVLMQSPAEKGQKVLMLGDDFWLLMPSSQRPMRITPMQKLLGDASTGDVATMSWSADYSAQLVGEAPCAAENDTRAAERRGTCYHLSLQASRKGVTYQRIELWIGKQRHEPVRADLYVQSDKLAKQARFIMDKPNAPTAVDAMVLVDALANRKETRVQYSQRKERTVPAEWLNPMPGNDVDAKSKTASRGNIHADRGTCVCALMARYSRRGGKTPSQSAENLHARTRCRNQKGLFLGRKRKNVLSHHDRDQRSHRRNGHPAAQLSGKCTHPAGAAIDPGG